MNDLPHTENNKNQGAFSKRFRIKTNTKYYFLNGILGFIGSPILLFLSTIAATQSQRLPPDWGERNNKNISSLFIILLFLLIIIIINIIGIISFTKENRGKGSYGIKLLKFMVLNIITLVASFIAFILIGSVIWKF
mgnify:FL=1